MASGTTAVSSDVLFPHFDPAQYSTGFGRFRLTATDTSGNSYKDNSVIFNLAANPLYKEIRMPFGAQPYGIAISPDGKYAYAAAHNPYLIGTVASSYVFQIDIDPTSPTYNRVIRNIAVGSVEIGSISQATQQQFVQSSIAPSGFRNVAVSDDGLHVYVTAPNANPDPNGAHAWTNLPGSLIDIDLTPTLTGGKPIAKAIPGSRGTYAVATTPGRPDVVHERRGGCGRGHGHDVCLTAEETETLLDLDKLASAGNSQLSVHNASSIYYADGKYAFITGRADQVNTTFGGGFNGVGLNAGGVSGFLDQTANPLYADGNVIQGSFGTQSSTGRGNAAYSLRLSGRSGHLG